MCKYETYSVSSIRDNIHPPNERSSEYMWVGSFNTCIQSYDNSIRDKDPGLRRVIPVVCVTNEREENVVKQHN